MALWGFAVQTAISESDYVKDTPRRKLRQPELVENARPLLYVQTPDALYNLEADQFICAHCVWAALYRSLGIRGEPKRVTDEMLMASPYLASWSAKFARKGVKALAKIGAIKVVSKGSRREVSLAWELATRRDKPAEQPTKKLVRSEPPRPEDLPMIRPSRSPSVLPPDWRKTVGLLP